jgi:hypothetical protein
MQTWVKAALGVVMVVSVAAAEGASDVRLVKDPDGQTMAVLVECNSCQTTGKGSKKCLTGVEEGFLDGQPCGKCMISENYATRVSFPYGIHLVGRLTDAKGEPIKNRFVKVYMANGWNVRTRTLETGAYRLMMGATAERKGGTPVVIDLGTRVDSPKDNKDAYAMFFLPERYKQCPAAAKPPAKKSKSKK